MPIKQAVYPQTTEMSQLTYLHSLSPIFLRNFKQFQKTWNILRKYPFIPRSLTIEESLEIAEALKIILSNIQFIHKLARLSNKGFIAADLVYICHFNEISKCLEPQCEALINWCGTDIDLIANYDSYYLSRIVLELIKFEETLDLFEIKWLGNPPSSSLSGCKPTINFRKKHQYFLNNPEEFNDKGGACIDRQIRLIDNESPHNMIPSREEVKKLFLITLCHNNGTASSEKLISTAQEHFAFIMNFSKKHTKSIEMNQLYDKELEMTQFWDQEFRFDMVQLCPELFIEVTSNYFRISLEGLIQLITYSWVDASEWKTLCDRGIAAGWWNYGDIVEAVCYQDTGD